MINTRATPFSTRFVKGVERKFPARTTRNVSQSTSAPVLHPRPPPPRPPAPLALPRGLSFAGRTPSRTADLLSRVLALRPGRGTFLLPGTLPTGLFPGFPPPCPRPLPVHCILRGGRALPFPFRPAPARASGAVPAGLAAFAAAKASGRRSRRRRRAAARAARPPSPAGT